MKDLHRIVLELREYGKNTMHWNLGHFRLWVSCYFSKPTFSTLRSHKTLENYGELQFHNCSTFSRALIFFLLTFFLLWLLLLTLSLLCFCPPLLHLSTLSEVWLLSLLKTYKTTLWVLPVSWNCQQAEESKHLPSLRLNHLAGAHFPANFKGHFAGDFDDILWLAMIFFSDLQGYTVIMWLLVLMTLQE